MYISASWYRFLEDCLLSQFLEEVLGFPVILTLQQANKAQQWVDFQEHQVGKKWAIHLVVGQGWQVP